MSPLVRIQSEAEAAVRMFLNNPLPKNKNVKSQWFIEAKPTRDDLQWLVLTTA